MTSSASSRITATSLASRTRLAATSTQWAGPKGWPILLWSKAMAEYMGLWIVGLIALAVLTEWAAILVLLPT